ncbi:OmpA family protein [Novispirillum itersonii]|uniref:Outer membrane protein OmpA-like peptidoglycan-associated protein n=1 Tax=Novispirillum itersonii TaxID=189 RepID=A0A7X0DNX8_NOVIT|nr:OmpA family protein [Novispirillum itersonii]MBB6210677.1 outer membrane protein OmpA-like peptidoglycan-associated protein [Novispirillum itersonii]
MFKKILLVTAAAGLLSACADQWNVDAVQKLPVTGGDFNKTLHQEYVKLAASEKAQGDWRDAAYFLRRAEAAARGEKVLPQATAERELAADKAAELSKARIDLLSALDAGGREKAPVMAAKAQTAGFDCWMEQQEEGHQPEDIAACKKAFDTNLTDVKKALEKKPEPVAEAKQQVFVVYFKTGASVLDPNAASVLQAAADAYKKTPAVTVVIAGHTDTAGADTANILLSQKRAERVADQLVKLGIKAESMALEAYGEQQLAVPTKDGVTELKNRRVEIKFRSAK